MKRTYLLILVPILLFSSSASADKRNFVWTYQYMTMPEKWSEIEFYQTTKLRTLDSWEYRIEVEHGITNHWDMAVYQIFSQTETAALVWDAFQLRTRFRFGDANEYILDPLLYLEYNRKIDSNLPNKFELKMVLAKTYSRTRFAINPVYEVYFAPGITHEVGLDAGFAIQVSGSLSLGIETTSRIEWENGSAELASYFGPTLSFSSGKFYYAMGAAIGVTEHADDAKVRFIMGLLL